MGREDFCQVSYFESFSVAVMTILFPYGAGLMAQRGIRQPPFATTTLPAAGSQPSGWVVTGLPWAFLGLLGFPVHRSGDDGNPFFLCDFSLWCCRAIWAFDDSHLVIGSMNRCIDILGTHPPHVESTLASDHCATVPARVAVHPLLPVIAAGNASGRVFIWKLPAT